MSRAEFGRWAEFHRRNPIDDHTLHLRTAAVIANVVSASTVGSDKAPSVDSLLQHLSPTPEEDEGWNLFEQLKRKATAPG